MRRVGSSAAASADAAHHLASVGPLVLCPAGAGVGVVGRGDAHVAHHQHVPLPPAVEPGRKGSASAGAGRRGQRWARSKRARRRNDLEKGAAARGDLRVHVLHRLGGPGGGSVRPVRQSGSIGRLRRLGAGFCALNHLWRRGERTVPVRANLPCRSGAARARGRRARTRGAASMCCCRMRRMLTRVSLSGQGSPAGTSRKGLRGKEAQDDPGRG